MAAELGPIDAVATHSFSGMALAQALAAGLDVKSVVLISPPARQSGQFERVWRRFNVSDEVIAAALALGHAEGRFFDLATIAPHLTADALFIHSLDDRQCPAEDARNAAAAWPHAKFWAVDGLGHRALVKDDDVVSMAAAWLVGS